MWQMREQGGRRVTGKCSNKRYFVLFPQNSTQKGNGLEPRGLPRNLGKRACISITLEPELSGRGWSRVEWDKTFCVLYEWRVGYLKHLDEPLNNCDIQRVHCVLAMRKISSQSSLNIAKIYRLNWGSTRDEFWPVLLIGRGWAEIRSASE